jgi:hypothetical protein
MFRSSWHLVAHNHSGQPAAAPRHHGTAARLGLYPIVTIFAVQYISTTLY